MTGLASRAMRLGKYFQPRKYLTRLQALTSRFSRPITDYEAGALTDLVYQKTVAFNRTTELDLGMGSERLLLAVGIALTECERGEPCRVLDFGGACGVHHKLATLLFSDAQFRWAVVETSSMVRRAQSLETESLRFFESIGAARTWLGSVDLVNSNSALQYVEDPLQTIGELLELAPKIVLWERLMLSSGATHIEQQRTMLFDHGPGAVPKGFRNRPVLNKITKLSRYDFLSAHEAWYRLRCKAEETEYPTYLFSRRKSAQGTIVGG
jgi:putative methyltransferase (TIGR04325 family)